jgi:hypothetical protein
MQPDRPTADYPRYPDNAGSRLRCKLSTFHYHQINCPRSTITKSYERSIQRPCHSTTVLFSDVHGDKNIIKRQKKTRELRNVSYRVLKLMHLIYTQGKPWAGMSTHSQPQNLHGLQFQVSNSVKKGAYYWFSSTECFIKGPVNYLLIYNHSKDYGVLPEL